jgi:hypothetical protein
MAHIFEGRWRSSVVKNGVPTPDDPFDLLVDEGSGQIKPGSKQGADDVRGAAGQAGPFHHIKIDVPIPNTPQFKRKYKGFLLVNGPQLIIVGVANLNPDFFEGKSDFKKGEIFNFFDQQQEVWIATKP